MFLNPQEYTSQLHKEKISTKTNNKVGEKLYSTQDTTCSKSPRFSTLPNKKFRDPNVMSKDKVNGKKNGCLSEILTFP